MTPRTIKRIRWGIVSMRASAQIMRCTISIQLISNEKRTDGSCSC